MRHTWEDTQQHEKEEVSCFVVSFARSSLEVRSRRMTVKTEVNPLQNNTERSEPRLKCFGFIYEKHHKSLSCITLVMEIYGVFEKSKHIPYAEI